MLKPDDRVVVYMRPGCHVCARVKKFLTENGVPYEARDVDSDPLTPRELWDLFNLKANRLRVPFTALNDGEDVVLGFDPQRLEGVFVHGELGGNQVSSAVSAAAVYDEYTSADVDPAAWISTIEDGATGGAADHGYDVKTGHGELRIAGVAGDASFMSTQRFGTPPGSLVDFTLDMSFEAEAGAEGEASHSPMGGPLAQLGVRDLPSGIQLGFEVTNDVILAVHRRAGVEGVAAANEHFEHRVLTGHPTTAGQTHRYRISYQHDTSQGNWFVDDTCVYTAVLPLQIEGFSLSMGIVQPAGAVGPTAAGPGRASAVWTPWQIGTG